MIPVDALQTAIRTRLLADPIIGQHVAAQHVRVGTVRPVQLPAILIAPTRSEILGRASGGQIVAEVSLMLHVWASTENDLNVAQDIGAAAFVAMLDAPAATGFAVDSWERPHMVWSDQSAGIGNAAHGAISLRAVIRWRD